MRDTADHRAVLDTNILVSATLSGSGAPRKLIEALARRHFDGAISDDTYAEYVEVLKRPKFGFSSRDIRNLLAMVRHHSRHYTAIPQPERTPDPDDQPFWDLAVTADAALVTGNVKDFPPSPRVRTPREFHDELSAGA